jgi:AbrB family looped-hinge helix DNA binding protein
MPLKKKIDEEALLKMVQDEVPQKEIMERFGFKTSTQLKVAYTNALMSTGKVPEIKSGRARGAKTPKTTIVVNKRGSLIIPKPLMEHYGLKEGQTFEVEKSKSGIAVKPAAPRPVTKLRKKSAAG